MNSPAPPQGGTMGRHPMAIPPNLEFITLQLPSQKHPGWLTGTTGAARRAVMRSVVLALVAWNSLWFCENRSLWEPLWEQTLEISMKHMVFWVNSVEMMGLKSEISKLLASSFVLLTLLIFPHSPYFGLHQLSQSAWARSLQMKVSQIMCSKQPST